MRTVMNLFLFLNLIFFGTLAAQDAPSEPMPTRPEQGFGNTLIMIAVAMIFFYLILWRPEQKRRKMMEEQRSGLKKGDRVVAMGIIGTVSKVNDNTVILKMVDESKIEVLKAAISETLPPQDDSKARKQGDEE